MPDNLEAKKIEELYRITCDGLNRLIDSSSNLDDKATKYLSSLGIVLSVIGFGVSSFIKPDHTIGGLMDALCLFLLVLLFFLLLIAAYIFMTVLTIRDHPMMPVSKELIEMFEKKDNDYIGVLRAMAKGNVKAFDQNDKVLKDKVMKIKTGEGIIVLSIFLAGVFIFFVSLKILTS